METYLTDSEILEFEMPDDIADDLSDMVVLGELKITETAMCRLVEYINR